jgi:hypothetical protein
MSSPAVIAFDSHRRRGRRFSRALAAEALLRAPVEDASKPKQPLTGRAWINGREVGGTEPHHAHLTESYD